MHLFFGTDVPLKVRSAAEMDTGGIRIFTRFPLPL